MWKKERLILGFKNLITAARIRLFNRYNKAFFPSKSSLGSAVEIKLTFNQ